MESSFGNCPSDTHDFRNSNASPKIGSETPSLPPSTFIAAGVNSRSPCSL
jgi:hypothetical protein